MHTQVRTYFRSVKNRFPSYFKSVTVLDCGSLDINGNNREFFIRSEYIGIDIVKGKNVDIVTKVHNYKPNRVFDIVISSEMLEHDKNYKDSLKRMYDLTKPNGMLLFTAAGFGRKEHGTTRTSPQDSPLTNDYYKNVTISMLDNALDFSNFKWYEVSYVLHDIRFAGIKK